MSDLVIGNEDYYRGYQQGREDAEEEVENRYNRVLDDEKKISYEQGKADAIEEYHLKLLNCKTDKVKSIHDAEIWVEFKRQSTRIAEQLKGKKNDK